MQVATLYDRIAARVIVLPWSGCWVWMGRLTEQDYGELTISAEGRKARVHRAIYELAVGPLDDELVLDHLCRVRCCCNPDHLEQVTVAENNRRMIAHKMKEQEPQADHLGRAAR